MCLDLTSSWSVSTEKNIKSPTSNIPAFKCPYHALFVIVLAAAEAAVALAFIINFFNNFRTFNVDDVSELKQ